MQQKRSKDSKKPWNLNIYVTFSGGKTKTRVVSHGKNSKKHSWKKFEKKNLKNEKKFEKYFFPLLSFLPTRILKLPEQMKRSLNSFEMNQKFLRRFFFFAWILLKVKIKQKI